MNIDYIPEKIIRENISWELKRDVLEARLGWVLSIGAVETRADFLKEKTILRLFSCTTRLTSKVLIICSDSALVQDVDRSWPNGNNPWDMIRGSENRKRGTHFQQSTGNWMLK